MNTSVECPRMNLRRSVLLLLILYVVLLFFTSTLVCASSESHYRTRAAQARRRRLLLKVDEGDGASSKANRTSAKIQSKVITKGSPKTQIKNLKASNSTKTFIKKLDASSKPSNSNIKKLGASSKPSIFTETLSKKLDASSKHFNFTKTQQLKKLNSTSKSSDPAGKGILKNDKQQPSDSHKSGAFKNKTSQSSLKSKNLERSQTQIQIQKQAKKKKLADENDFVSDFTDLPYKFQQTLLPDLDTISQTSKAYLTKANTEITKNVSPIVGERYASSIASAISFAFLIIPLLLVSLMFNQIKTYFSLQRLLIFVHAYLCIYFSILCITSLVTGVEPLSFFYGASSTTYVFLQALQMLGYALYLLLLLVHLVLVFPAGRGLGSRILGLGQAMVGFSLGLHYYVAVFHRAVQKQPPETSWRVHGVYATCFFVIGLLALADRRKKMYLEEGGDEGKTN